MQLPAIAALKRFARFPDVLPEMLHRVAPGLDTETARAVIACITQGARRPPLPVDPPAEAMNQAVLDTLGTWATAIDWTTRKMRPEHCRSLIASPVQDQDLCDLHPYQWSPLLLLVHTLLSSIVPTRPPAVVTTTRDDGLRIIEFVAHYRAIGFDHIYIYSNGSADGSDELLEALAAHGVVTYIRNDITGTVAANVKAMEHSLWKLPELRQHEWVFYPDSDEFLILPASFDHSINSVVAHLAERYGDKPPASVCYNWKWMVSGTRYAASAEPLLTSFTHGEPHDHVKSLVRLADALIMRAVHFPQAGHRDFFVDSMLHDIPQSRSIEHKAMWNQCPPCYAGGQLNHYFAKSFEEFALKKHRGYGDIGSPNDRNFDQFFDWNSPETQANHDPCPPVLLQRVLDEMQRLRQLPGVIPLEDIIRSRQPAMLAAYGTQADLRRIYDELEARRHTA